MKQLAKHVSFIPNLHVLRIFSFALFLTSFFGLTGHFFQISASDSYTLVPSDATIHFTSDPNTGYGINVVLRDGNGQIPTNQSDIEYSFLSNNTDIVKVSKITEQCVSPVQPPCPRTNVQLLGFKSGSTTLLITAKKHGPEIARTTVTVNVTQPGEPWPPVSPSPSIVATPSVLPTPKPTAKVSSPKPVIQKVPLVSPPESLTASSSLSPQPDGSVVPSSTPTTELVADAPKEPFSKKSLILLAVLGVIVLGVAFFFSRRKK